ncbi:MAG: MFS transporter [Piscinibacter sp.]|uniref:MFS transporter n=1 Tax=Piscinibacter sp. TaxID=1903157 RepID=UPI003D0D0827
MTTPPGASAQARWALLAGNFVIGCGVMVVAGTLNDLARSLEVSVALAGQLIALGAVVMGVGAPLLANWVAGFDRRRLLALTLAWYGAGHALSALMPDYASLAPVRALCMLGAAVFTPQAAAAIGHMSPPEQRGRAITFVFLGWSVASVAGMPMAAWIGETFGWRSAFATVAVLGFVAAGWVYAAVPDGVKPAALSRAAWREALTQPALMAIVIVTALQSAGQFTLFSYFAPYYRQTLDASPAQISAIFFWFGLFGLLGNVLLTRHIDRFGAARCVSLTLVLITMSLLAWPLAGSLAAMAVVLVPWALGCFSTNSAQQARLGLAAPALAPALMALNTSAIYLGQAVGAASGGVLVASSGFTWLSPVGVLWMLVAIALSAWATRRMRAAR